MGNGVKRACVCAQIDSIFKWFSLRLHALSVTIRKAKATTNLDSHTRAFSQPRPAQAERDYAARQAGLKKLWRSTCHLMA